MTPEAPILRRMYSLLDGWEAAADHRAVFLSCYAMMTRNMLDAVAAGGFHDPRWVTQMLNHFAGYYFKAVDAYDHQNTCSAVWLVAFTAARDPQTHVLQNLFLGVNAHINYDLVLTLVDLLRATWDDLPAASRHGRYQDYCTVNDIIAATINEVQDQVIERYEPVMDTVDKLFGPLDEWLIARLISGWRAEVWEHATALLVCRDEASSTNLRQQVEQHALARARAIGGERGIAGITGLV